MRAISKNESKHKELEQTQKISKHKEWEQTQKNESKHKEWEKTQRMREITKNESKQKSWNIWNSIYISLTYSG